MPPSADPTVLAGVVERIIFLNEETHYTIAEFRPDVSGGRDRAEPVTIVGPLPGVECGETLHLTGEWTSHAQHGPQFKVGTFRSELPASVYGIRKYLGSGLVPGIGKVYANKIVDVFGTDTFRVLSEESGKLRDVPGIGRKRAAAIKGAWDEKRTERELYIFLQTYGVTPGQCVKLVQRYGGQAKDVLSREPYRVAREIDGIGFKTADRIAINLGFANDAPPRLDAGLIYALDTLQEEGHTAYPEEDLIAYAANLLETSADRVTARAEALVQAKQLVRHAGKAGLQSDIPTRFLQLPRLDHAERKIADVVGRLTRVASGLPPIKIGAAVQWIEGKAGLVFNELQRAAVENALGHKVSILTGGPGTGKTTCLRALVEVLKAKKARVHLAAPTGRAAQRLAATTGGFASTIHRLLKYDPATGGFTANQDHPLATDFLIVDEVSMLDTRLAAALFAAVPAKAHLLLVGDADQLPSVGAGNVLKDLIAVSRDQEVGGRRREAGGGSPPASNLQPPASVTAIAVTRLAVIYRQQGHSLIVTTAHAVNAGDPSLPPAVPAVAAVPPGADLAFIAADSAEDCLAKVLELCTTYLPRHYPSLDPVGDVQVIAPMHKGVAGVSNLNAQLQGALNGRAPGLRTVAGEFRPGDKIIQLRNNYDKNLFNGDIGSVKAVDAGAGSLTADFDGERHSFARGDFGDLALAYAMSIHKSQGSEYPVVIIALLKGHFMMLQRNLLYTAITRGRKKVFLVGEPAAYAMAVRNSESKLRITHLRQKILEAARMREALRRLNIWPAAAIFAATLLAYLPAMRGAFLWNDSDYVTAPKLRSLHGLWRIWFELNAVQQYYPALHSAFWIEHRLWGDAVVGYHLTNVILHATAACLFAVILRRLAVPGAWLAGAIFALHPVCVESVAWITEQKNTLSTVFYLSAAIAYLRWREEEGGGRTEGSTLQPPTSNLQPRAKLQPRALLWYLIATAFYLAAILSKSVAATLPAALLVIVWWQEGSLSWRRDARPLLPWFGLGAAVGLLTAYVEFHFMGAQGDFFHLGFLDRFIVAGRVVWFYLGKIFWPADLIFIYPHWDIRVTAGQLLFPLGLLGLLAALWLWRRRSRAPLAALLLLIGSLFPVLGFLNVFTFTFSYVADHFLYLPCLGVIALAAAGLGRMNRPIIAGAVLCALGFLTWRQSFMYRDSPTLYRTIIGRNPDCWMAHNNLGVILRAEGKVEAARAQYLAALRIRPDYPEAHNNMGLILQVEGRRQEAVEEYLAALEGQEGFVDVHRNLANVLAEMGRTKEAYVEYERALQLRPDYAETWCDLGDALFNEGRYSEAASRFVTALKCDPGHLSARFNLGCCLVKMGRPEAGAEQFREVLLLNPNIAEAHIDLGLVLDGAGKHEEARRHFEAAVRVSPDSPEAQFNLANVLFEEGRLQEAIGRYETVLRLNPGYVGAHNNLGVALAADRQFTRAIGEYETALRLKPDYADARNNLAKARAGLAGSRPAAGPTTPSGSAPRRD